MPAASIQTRQIPALSLGSQRCLLLGAKGAGMTALGEILRDAGHTTIGMDRAVSSTSQSPTTSSTVCLPWESRHVPEADVCVASPAVPNSDPVLKRVHSDGIPCFTLPQVLAGMFSGKQQICVAGTHGKSTTTSMLTWILEQTGRSPSCFVGANQPDLGCSGRFTSSGPAVLESCEFGHSFLHFAPTVAVLTSVERDHFDCFPDEFTEDTAFEKFVGRLPGNGKLIYDANSRRSGRIAATSTAQKLTFGLGGDQNADFIGSNIRHLGWETYCDIRHERDIFRLRLQVPGRHNAQNACAAIAAAAAVDVSPVESCAALAEFHGIDRRFECRGSYRGITLIDDYAHHPTAVTETLTTARRVFPGRRLIAAFEPHQVIRTEALFPKFIKALAIADEILVLPVFPARETVTPGECCRLSGRLVRELNAVGTKAFLFANLDQIVSRVDHSARATDIFVTMGAGRTNLIHDELTRRLQRHSVA